MRAEWFLYSTSSVKIFKACISTTSTNIDMPVNNKDVKNNRKRVGGHRNENGG